MGALNPKQQRFVAEYLIDLNATQAAIRAGYSAKTASQIGERLLRNVEVQKALSEAMKKREQRTEITQDMVLQRWWEIANADVNGVVQFRRSNCRRCHGVDFGYQWTEDEYNQAVAEAKEGEQPELLGGFGFVRNRQPNPACPHCSGEGSGFMHVNDTRELKGPAKLIYRGVQQSKDGLKVILADQDKALENVARHLGMFKEKVELTGANGGPIQTQDVTKTDLTDEELAEELKKYGIEP